MGVLELAGVLTGILAVWLTTRQRILCWPVGIVSVVIFIAVFYRARLYGAMGLQAVYVALAIYGWHAWLHGGRGHGRLTVSRVPHRHMAWLACAGAVATAGLGAALARWTDAALPVLDAGTTSFSLVAQWMQTRKWLENWLVWLVVDVVYVGINLSQELALTAGLYVVYLGLAAIGWRDWRRSMREVH
ncbi:MAG: nicotinamide riboside transporter PnuC [Acidobacteriota bacterium]